MAIRKNGDRRIACLPLATGILLLLGAGGTARSASPSEEFFEKRIRPVLASQCQNCHGPKKSMGGLRLDSREAMIQGGDNGPAILPGNANKSRLIEAIRHKGDLKMPPKKPLSPDEVDALVSWVNAGAPWPKHASSGSAASPDAWKNHWAFQPVSRPQPPLVKQSHWTKNPIDQFVLAKLEARGLSPSAPADRSVFLRRISDHLLGLPPDKEMLDAFGKDSRPGAASRIVDQMMASPHLGERFARRWLDLARFADTKGYVFFEEAEYPWAWTYRDYVIESFNEDKPYNRFVLEQLAADHLPSGKDRSYLRALGFLSLGGRFMNNVHDIIDDRIDVVTRGLTGMTMACARCHDHKYDPMPSEDYYSLHGVFASLREPTVPPLFQEPPNTAQYQAFQKEMAKREQALEAFLAQKFEEVRNGARRRLSEYILAAHKRKGQPRGDDFMLIADGNDLNPTMLVRWQSYLERTAKSPHRIWKPWHLLGALSEKEFAQKAEALIAELRTDREVNPLVVRVLQPSPKSMAELANRYGTLFHETAGIWDAEKRQKPGSVSCSDPDREELRQVLESPDSPANLLRSQISELELLPDRASQGKLQELRKPVEQWRASGPGAPPRANVLEDLPVPVEPVVFRRGNPNNPAQRVPRRLPVVFAKAGDRKPFQAGSGRLELAESLVDPRNPLTSRVLVNRLWLHFFGVGLVQTAGDFGLRSSPPSHPELLDWLAAELVHSGWSVKHIVRLIVTSATYGQKSADRPEGRAVDPDNILLWRMPRQPRDLESLRDALLFVSGQLDQHLGGPSIKDAMATGSRRRTLYSWVDRLHVPVLFRTFDFPSPDTSSPGRDRTLVPQQALFLMNSPFAIHAAEKLAARVLAEGPRSTEDQRIDRLFLLSLGRHPDPRELAGAQNFLIGQPRDEGIRRLAQALFLCNEFVFVD